MTCIQLYVNIFRLQLTKSESFVMNIFNDGYESHYDIASLILCKNVLF